jgi:hypothetical protein
MLGTNSGMLEVLSLFSGQAHHHLRTHTESIKMADALYQSVEELLRHNPLLCLVDWMEPSIESSKKQVQRRGGSDCVQIQQRLHLFLVPLTPGRWIES